MGQGCLLPLHLHAARTRSAPVAWTRRLGWICVLAALACSSVSRAADPEEGTSSRYERRRAQKCIPFSHLDGDGQAKVREVLSDVAIYRRMPIEVIQCDPDLYVFMVHQPDAVVNIWEILGISEVGLTKTGPNLYRADDGHGTLSDVEYLYRDKQKCLIYAEGTYEGPLFTRKVKGKCLMLLQAGFITQPDGTTYVTHRLDTFINLDSFGWEVLAKTFQPLMGKVADRNFVEISSFMSSFSRKAQRDPEWTQRIVERLDNVEPEVREDLAKLAVKLGEQPELERVNLEQGPPPIGRPTTASRRAPVGQ